MKVSPLVILSCLLCIGAFASTRAEVANNLIPQPAIMQLQPGRVLITKDFAIRASRYSDDRLRRAIQRAVTRLENRTGFELMQTSVGGAGSALVIDVQRSGDSVQSRNEVESYMQEVAVVSWGRGSAKPWNSCSGMVPCICEAP